MSKREDVSQTLGPNGHGEGLQSSDLETVIGKIQSITGARVVTGASGQISEIHVLATPDRAPKQLVRDIQSAAMATFGLDIDYRKISVVQLEDGHVADSAPPGPPVAVSRPTLAKLTTEMAGRATAVRAELGLQGESAEGTATGPSGTGVQLVASAVLDAVGDLFDSEDLTIDFADVVSAGARSVALVIVRRATSRGDQLLSGSAVLRTDPYDAAARATLDALNRVWGRA